MLPDLRFFLGAVLAITLLAVAGLGLVTSVQLVREAHLGPLPDSRSLAFAGHAERNEFYDPASARRFEGSAPQAATPVAPLRLETPPEGTPVAAGVGAPERTASIPPDRSDADIAAPPPAEAARTPAPDAPGETEPEPPPADRVAPAPSPAATLLQEPPVATAAAEIPSQASTPAGTPLRVSTPPNPPARPKQHFRKRIVRHHIRRHVNVASQPPLPSTGFPSPNPAWPPYDNQWTGAAAKKGSGKLTGTTANRPQ